MSPYDVLGADLIRDLAARFYAIMDRDEPALARLHPLDEQGRVAQPNRDRFAMFLVGWLGGPDDYIAQHGHPALRRRHAGVLVDEAMRDAWVRCMYKAMDELGLEGPVRTYLNGRFFEVADFLRNDAVA